MSVSLRVLHCTVQTVLWNGCDHNPLMSARWWTFLVWALVAGSGLFWGLRLFVRPAAVPERTPVASAGPVARGDLTRLLGVDAPPPTIALAAEPPPDARFQLIGVVAARSPAAAREGVALIAVDGKPAKAYRVGAVVDGQTILKSVAVRGVALGPRNDAASQFTLSLTPLPAAATGTLPGIDIGGGAGGQTPAFGIAPRAPTATIMAAPQLLTPRNSPPPAGPQDPSPRRILPPPLPQQARDQAMSDRRPLGSTDTLPGSAPLK